MWRYALDREALWRSVIEVRYGRLRGWLVFIISCGDLSCECVETYQKGV
jgi:hypothetical protein